MNEMLRRRPRSLAAIAAGAAAVLLMGGLVAMTSDSIRSQGNNARSGEYTPPAQNLQIALIDNVPAGCLTATYTDADVAAVITTQGFTLGWGDGQPDGLFGKVVCLKNAGLYTGQLVVTAENVVDTEVGACSENEVTIGGDATCEDGDVGEFSEVFSVTLSGSGTFYGGTGWPTCVDQQSLYLRGSLSSPVELAASLAPGQICSVYTDLRLDGVLTGANPEPTEATKALTQTDETTWDLVFTLQDAEV